MQPITIPTPMPVNIAFFALFSFPAPTFCDTKDAMDCIRELGISIAKLTTLQATPYPEEAASTAPAESTAAESTSTNGKKYEGVELTMWSMWSAGEVQANAIQAAADAFEAETGAHVNIEWKGRDVNTLISAALESGEKLDIFEDDYNRIGHAYAPYTYDLTEMADAVGYDDFSYAFPT